MAEINGSAKNGIQVGAGQSGGSTRLGPGLSARVAAEVARIGHDVFTFAYVTAMRQTMLLPIILLGVGALSCLAIKQDGAAARATAQDVEPGQMAGTISSPGSSGQSPGSTSGTVS